MTDEVTSPKQRHTHHTYLCFLEQVISYLPKVLLLLLLILLLLLLLLLFYFFFFLPKKIIIIIKIKKKHPPTPSLYHGRAMTLLVRPRIKTKFY